MFKTSKLCIGLGNSCTIHLIYMVSGNVFALSQVETEIYTTKFGLMCDVALQRANGMLPACAKQKIPVLVRPLY